MEGGRLSAGAGRLLRDNQCLSAVRLSELNHTQSGVRRFCSNLNRCRRTIRTVTAVP
jgi:hypothetical protein